MKFDKAYFDAGLERRGTDCMKWDGMLEEHHDPDMVPMWVADMDFPSAPAIRDERRGGCVRAARLLETPPRGQL